MYYQLEYYYKNKQKYLEKYSHVVSCPVCNLEMRFSSLKPHMKTKKCLFYKKNGCFPWNLRPKPKKGRKKKDQKKVFKPEDFILKFD